MQYQQLSSEENERAVRRGGEAIQSRTRPAIYDEVDISDLFVRDPIWRLPLAKHSHQQ